MAVRSATVVVKNATRETILVLQTATLAHGEWDAQPATTEVFPGMLTAWTSQSNGFATGTQGVAHFALRYQDPQQSSVWSLRRELVLMAPFLPVGFTAAHGIRSLYPAKYIGTIRNLGQFFNEKYAGQSVTFNWDNPFVGNNSFSGSAPSPFTVSQQGGIGNNAVAVLTLAD